MSTYSPAAGVFAGRPPCAHCGAAYRLHVPAALGHRPLGQHEPRHPCPEAYRPATVEVARRELAAAEASGEQARIFVARGELQRLEGRGPRATDDDDAAWAEDALGPNATH